MSLISCIPSAYIKTLRKRARILTDIRTFFNTRGYLEVETPSLSRFGLSDVYLSSVSASIAGEPYFLQTSPEYAMKRLLAAGSGPIYQIARVYRDDELGRWHNPEFTMLEWYALGVDHHGLMLEVEELLQEVLNIQAIKKITYRQAFITACELDPFSASISEFQSLLERFELDKVLPKETEDRSLYLFLLMTHIVEPYLATFDMPVAVYDFPKEQAALAIVSDPYAHRFEIYYRGIELANGFHELQDVAIQHERFLADNQERIDKGLEPVEIDSFFLAALEAGLPKCSGVAVGLDRLVALALGATSLAEIMAFDFSRC